MNVFFLLSSFGLAITSVAQRCSKPTGGSNMHLRDEYITKNTFEDGASVSFSCAPGYTSAGGSPQITCSAGTWSTLQLKCERRNCGTLPEVNKGDIEYKDGTEFGDTAVVTCRSGYMLVGQSVLRCEVQGWTGRVPTCDEVKCVTPPEIVNGRFSPKKDFYGYREVVQYTCDQDLELRGSRDLFCSENGKFSSAAPTCVRVECEDPVIINGFWESGSRPPHKYRATVTFKCKPEYTMIGNSTVTCDIDSKWSPGLPKCTMVKCVTPPEIVNGRFSPKKDFYGYREVVQYTCDKDLELRGSRDLFCTENGKFSSAAPTCVRVECKDPVIINGFWESGSRPPHKYRATVTFKCKPEYTMIGNSTVTCDIDSKWSPGLPKCTSNIPSNGNALVGGLTGALVVTIPILLVQNYWI